MWMVVQRMFAGLGRSLRGLGARMRGARAHRAETHGLSRR